MLHLRAAEDRQSALGFEALQDLRKILLPEMLRGPSLPEEEGMSEITKELKEIFRAAAELRKAQGIEFVKLQITMDKPLRNACFDMWDRWCELLGTDRAGMFLHHCMMRYSEVLENAKERQDRKKKR